MPTFSVSVNTEVLNAAVTKAVAALEPPALTEIVSFGADELLIAAQLNAPEQSGALKRSIDKEPIAGGAWRIGPDTEEIPYAFIQEFGGDIYDIVPKYANVLHFQVGGANVFTRRVAHVHIPGSHYMQNGFEAGIEPAIAAVQLAVNRTFEG